MHNDSLHTERELLLLIAEGDQHAFRQLFEIYWKQVFGACLQLTKSPELAKDLSQDIFLKIWNTRNRLTDVRSFKSYLFTIARNTVRDQLRTTVFRESNREFLEHYFSGKAISPQQVLEQKQLSDRLMRAINSLPPKLHQVFMLSHLEGLSHKEIAERLEISPLSSKTYMVRALLILRRELVSEPDRLLIIGLIYLSNIFSFFF
ncbi:MAG TPA: RNA polymerase sigma-70 factor [Chitinophaga sp.]|uniref:RNA polymerase sigma factor n=1 Tax=Chitinophaga sp. TaxID=1869181 RepID=UPI002C4EA875|nr:RNA polymerase sigma-70 factor [Chitinophaga sp.]HVI45126.1 RNA polymerase sigma-70 factor [Chitinophaga sp.]